MRTTVAKGGSVELFARIAGDRSDPALILLHGWPHDGSLYDPVIDRLGERFFTIAFDLPAIGRSTGAPPSAEKATLASVILDAAASLGAERPVVAGIDVGGMIAYSAARDFAERIHGVAIGNTVIPGLDPWQKVISDPRIFHFALHAVPDLPELLVTGRERPYFDFFFDFLGSKQRPLPNTMRDAFTRAYLRPEALSAGFDWYRAFARGCARERTAEAAHHADPLFSRRRGRPDAGGLCRRTATRRGRASHQSGAGRRGRIHADRDARRIRVDDRRFRN